MPYRLHAQSVLTNDNAYINIVDDVRVSGDTIDNLAGNIRNFGYIHLTGNFNNAANALGNGRYYIGGNWNNTGIFNPGNSEVLMVGSLNQQIINSGSGKFYTLEINNDGLYPGSRIFVRNDIEITTLLRMVQGNIQTDANIVYLSNPLSSALDWSAGRIIGRFERSINSLDNYLFPLGAENSYNPMNLDPISLNSPGSLLTEFIRNNPGDAGLPVFDDSLEVYNALDYGYWDLRDRNGFNIAEYDVRLGYDGFDPDSIQAITRVLSRAEGGPWGLDGRHRDADGNDAMRDSLKNGILFPSLQLGLGKGRPRIIDQPVNDTVCELDDASFSVRARGRRLEYQWQVNQNDGNGWQDLADTASYSGTETDELTISPAFLYMNGYQYRVVITDRFDNRKYSDAALLIVVPLPTATAVPDELVICNEKAVYIELISDIPGTLFGVSVIENDSVLGATASAPGIRDIIEDTLTNVGNTVNVVRYVITPFYNQFGNLSCPGYTDTVTVWVNPTPRIDVEVSPDTILCNEGFVEFDIDSLVSTFGTVRYEVDVSRSSGNVTNQVATDSLGLIGILTDQLINTGNVVESVTYTFTPYIENGADSGDCGRDPDTYPGTDTTITIYVNPTPRMDVDIDDIFLDRCNDTTVIFNTDSLVSSTGTVRYRVTADYGSSITGNLQPGGEEQFIGMGLLTDRPVNAGFGVDSVTYTFVPYIENANSVGNRECQNGDTLKITLRINPTPSMKVAISDPLPQNGDTIFCNNTEVFFTLTSDIMSTTGNLLHDLSVTGDVAEVNGESTYTGQPIADFSDILSHGEPDIRQIDYLFEPFIENVMSAGCRVSLDTTVIVKVVPELTFDVRPDTVYIGEHEIRCNGLTGGFNLRPIGGDYRFPYDVTWRDDGGGQLLSETVDSSEILGLPAGEYLFEITDIIGCEASGRDTLTEPQPLEIILDSLVQPPCAGPFQTGSIYVTVNGGIEGYAYEWENKLTGVYYDTRYVIDGSQGEYDLVVTDTNSCVQDDVFEIDPPDVVNAFTLFKSAYGEYNVSCNGNSDGIIEVSATGGTGVGTYTYTWYDEGMNVISNDARIENQPAGIYQCEILDGNGCAAQGGMYADTLTEPDPIAFEKVPSDYPGGYDISCFGRSDGRLDIIYSGGHIDTVGTSPDYSIFDWTTADGSGIVPGDHRQSGLTVGTYAVQVTDVDGWCTADTSFTLNSPDTIQMQYSLLEYPGADPKNVSCFGFEDGAITIDTVFGGDTIPGDPHFTYEWIPPDGYSLPDPTLRNLQDIPAGKYYITITDNVGCQLIDSIELSTPDSLWADVWVDTIGTTDPKNGFEIRCYGNTDGYIDLDTYGGTEAYSYAWTRDGAPISGTTELTDLAVGSYGLTITDLNNCIKEYAFLLESPDSLALNAAPDFIECFGDTSSIYLSPTGGNTGGPYAYDWYGAGPSQSNLHGVTAGTYPVRVTDINNCFTEEAVVLEESPEILISLDVTSDYSGRGISCFGETNGEITATVTGGRRNYQYDWEGIAGSDSVISGLGEGWYLLTIEDDYGCLADDSIFLQQPDSISLVTDSETQDPFCNGDKTGRIGLIASGGTGPYFFSWSHDANITEGIADGLGEGSYTITAFDLNGCENEITVTLTAPQPLVMEIETTLAECKDSEDGSITVSADGGTFPYSVELDGIPDDGDGFFDFLGPGYYTVEVTDSYGCSIRDDSVYVEAESLSCLDIVNAFTPNGDGVNDVWIIDDEGGGLTDMVLYPEAELRIYNRWGELIYYTNDVVGEPWDGTYKGRELPIDSYYFILDLNNGDDPATGNVTIIR